MRGAPGKNEGDRRPGADAGRRRGAQIFVHERDRRMQLDRIRPSHRMRAEILALEPGRGAAITETQHELAMPPHSPAVAANEAPDIDVTLVAGAQVGSQSWRVRVCLSE